MPGTRLTIPVAEPFDCARLNGGKADLADWTAQGINIRHPRRGGMAGPIGISA